MSPEYANALIRAIDDLDIECGEAWASHVNDDLDVKIDWPWIVDRCYKRASAIAQCCHGVAVNVEIQVGQRILSALEQTIFADRDNVCGPPDEVAFDVEKRGDIRPAPQLDWKGESV